MYLRGSHKAASAASAADDSSSSSSQVDGPRKGLFQGSYREAGGTGGGFHRNTKDIKDPPNPLKLLEPLLEQRGQPFLMKARTSFKRKGMPDSVTKALVEDAKMADADKRTPEGQRMLDFPKEGLQNLGVERNHKNANGQFATHLTAFASSYLASPASQRPQVALQYQGFAEAHGLEKKQAASAAKEFAELADQIDGETQSAKRQRTAERLISSQTSKVADNPGNLTLGPSQRAPRQGLNIVVPTGPHLGSNQDVGSNWDGNRKLDGSHTPRSQTLHDALHLAEHQGNLAPGMAAAATTRPFWIATGTPFGSVQHFNPGTNTRPAKASSKTLSKMSTSSARKKKGTRG